MNPAEHVLQFFTCDHLPAKLAEVSKPFCELAQRIAIAYPNSRETTKAMNKLLEAKDAAVRAALDKTVGGQ